MKSMNEMDATRAANYLTRRMPSPPTKLSWIRKIAAIIKSNQQQSVLYKDSLTRTDIPDLLVGDKAFAVEWVLQQGRASSVAQFESKSNESEAQLRPIGIILLMGKHNFNRELVYYLRALRWTTKHKISLSAFNVTTQTFIPRENLPSL